MSFQVASSSSRMIDSTDTIQTRIPSAYLRPSYFPRRSHSVHAVHQVTSALKSHGAVVAHRIWLAFWQQPASNSSTSQTNKLFVYQLCSGARSLFSLTFPLLTASRSFFTSLLSPRVIFSAYTGSGQVASSRLTNLMTIEPPRLHSLSCQLLCSHQRRASLSLSSTAVSLH